MSKKITKVHIDGFRACPKPFELDFTNGRDGRPSSALILGDNGTGKSTIVDALEFALQATFQRHSRLQGPNTPSVLSLNGASRASIKVVFGDGTEASAEVRPDADGKLVRAHRSHPSYRVAPIVLRRKDILAFLNSTEEQRQLIFVDFFRHLRPQPEAVGNRTEELIALRDERTRLKNKRRETLGLIAAELSIKKESVPRIEADFKSFIKQHVFKGQSGKERQRLLEEGDLYVPDELQALIGRANELFELTRELDRQISSIQQEHKAPIPEVIQRTSAFFGSVADSLTSWFKRVSNARSFIDSIRITPGSLSVVALGVELHLSNGWICTPHNVLSEANLDLIALLLFVAIAKEASKSGQEKLLILDDVLQSVDSTIRLQFAAFLLEEFQDWQLILTVHDRLWFNQLRDLFRRFGRPVVERQLVRWDFGSGPTSFDNPVDTGSRLATAIAQGDIEGICGSGGLLLELICDRLSVNLMVSVTRRKEDKYTLGDLWPGVLKQLKKSTLHTIALDVDRFVHLRNLVGAHYNDWAQTVSLHDAVSFGQSVMQLHSMVNCLKCGTWIEAPEKGDPVCRCGMTVLKAK